MNCSLQAIAIAGLFCFSTVMPVLAQQPSTTPVNSAVTSLDGAVLYAELSKTIDAKKAKTGDPVTALLLADVMSKGRIVARHDAKLMGHVTEAQQHSKENPESRLGIVFDKVMLKDGQELAFHSMLLAIRPPERPQFDVPSAPAPPGTSQGAAAAADRHYPMPKGPTQPKMSPTMTGAMEDQSKYVAGSAPTGIDGLSLTAPANDGSRIIVSLQHTVKLESGVRLELRISDSGRQP
jgi:hypothetical protein